MEQGPVPPESLCAQIVRSAKTKPKFAKLLSSIGNIDVQCVDCSQYGAEGNAKALIRVDPLAIQICQVSHISLLLSSNKLNLLLSLSCCVCV